MAKKLNPFAADFEGISKSADDKVLALLKDAEPKAKTAPKRKSAEAKANDSSEHAEREDDSKDVEQKPKKGTRKKAKENSNATEEWGKPVAHFNTRIPERMAELLDDLVYKLRKKGEQRTKQDLAQEALHDLLRKHYVL